MNLEFSRSRDFEFSGKKYSKLFENSSATGFQSPVWLGNLNKLLAPKLGMAPLAIEISSDGKLLGVVPLLQRKLKGLTLVESTDAGVSDYAAPVLEPKLEQELKRDAQASQKFKQAIGSFDILRIRPVLPEHVDAWKALVGCEPVELDFSSHAVELSQPHDVWRDEHMEKSLRSMMMKKQRRWKKQCDVIVERLEEPSDIEAAIGELASMRKGRFEGDPIQGENVRRFYARVAAEGGRVAAAETWRITSDGEVAVIVFGLTHKGQFLYLLIGANYDDFGRHSPGLVAYDCIIDDWSARGGKIFDFTIGDEPFKAKFGTQPKRMSAFLASNSLKGRLAVALLSKKLRR